MTFSELKSYLSPNARMFGNDELGGIRKEEVAAILKIGLPFPNVIEGTKKNRPEVLNHISLLLHKNISPCLSGRGEPCL
jgi:hypothetical protein